MNHRIVLTRPGGYVSIVCPSMNAIRYMGSGGRWPGATRGWLDQQIERSLTAGMAEAAVRRHVHAMQFGGCTTAEALAIIRDRDCAHRGTGIELWPAQDVSADRWFRDAWRRAESGGPIWIDLPTARLIQLRKTEQAVGRHNKAAVEEDDRVSLAGRLTNGPAFVEFDRRRIRDRLLAASTLEQVRAVWPEGLT